MSSKCVSPPELVVSPRLVAAVTAVGWLTRKPIATAVDAAVVPTLETAASSHFRLIENELWLASPLFKDEILIVGNNTTEG
ncbi:hypothetical protein D3C81_2229130 [compost metagenome]